MISRYENVLFFSCLAGCRSQLRSQRWFYIIVPRCSIHPLPQPQHYPQPSFFSFQPLRLFGIPGSCLLPCLSQLPFGKVVNISSWLSSQHTSPSPTMFHIYIDCQVVSRQSNQVSSSRNTGPPSFSSENMIIFLMILVISRLVLVGDDHLRLSIQKRSPILF